MSGGVDLGAGVNVSGRFNLAARANTSGGVDLAAEPICLEKLTWPPEWIRLEG